MITETSNDDHSRQLTPDFKKPIRFGESPKRSPPTNLENNIPLA